MTTAAWYVHLVFAGGRKVVSAPFATRTAARRHLSLARRDRTIIAGRVEAYP